MSLLDVAVLVGKLLGTGVIIVVLAVLFVAFMAWFDP